MRFEKTRSELVNAIPIDLSILGDSTIVAGVVVDRNGRVLETNTRFLAFTSSDRVFSNRIRPVRLGARAAKGMRTPTEYGNTGAQSGR
jgi:hypothetical protein